MEDSKKEAIEKAAKVKYRRCSYSPLEDAYVAELDGFRGEAKNKAVNIYVNGRVKWFLTFCEENNIIGRIEESDVTILPELNMITVVARVYMNGELVADGIAGTSYTLGDPVSMGTVVQSCATKAKGRALANAGFNLNGIEEVSDLVTPDGGVQLPSYAVSGGQIIVDPENPFGSVFVADPNHSEGGHALPPSKKKQMTYEEAAAIVCPISNMKGKTLGEIAATAPQQLEWYTGSEFKSANRYPELVEGAKVILAHLKM